MLSCVKLSVDKKHRNTHLFQDMFNLISWKFCWFNYQKNMFRFFKLMSNSYPLLFHFSSNYIHTQFPACSFFYGNSKSKRLNQIQLRNRKILRCWYVSPILKQVSFGQLACLSVIEIQSCFQLVMFQFYSCCWKLQNGGTYTFLRAPCRFYSVGWNAY